MAIKSLFFDIQIDNNISFYTLNITHLLRGLNIGLIKKLKKKLKIKK